MLQNHNIVIVMVILMRYSPESAADKSEIGNFQLLPTQNQIVTNGNKSFSAFSGFPFNSITLSFVRFGGGLIFFYYY